MKKLILCVFTVFFSFSLFAQTDAQQKVSKEATMMLTKLYNLDTQQTAEMQKIQDRKQRNLSEIETLKEKDQTLYVQKMKALVYGTDMSIRRLLKEEQIAVFNQQQTNRRTKKAEMYHSMKAAGTALKDIELQTLEMELKEF